ncbi:unnamed protein product [Nyctereutes procyonoides]|uniref:(raccoon dog) hypothetical protein n=1 Tax=Nyctereutes procyonoides TaxID=34880 RepID=A0A811YUF1_NYCPR|nr:unnamed protein product [Nyctereutes procyonoides]
MAEPSLVTPSMLSLCRLTRWLLAGWVVGCTDSVYKVVC